MPTPTRDDASDPRARATHRIRVEPAGIVLAAEEGESIMGAARRLGYVWPTLCNGDGTCTICWIELMSGEANLSTCDDAESRSIDTMSKALVAGRTVRLACQARVHGDAEVRKRGVRRAGPSPAPSAVSRPPDLL